MSEGADDEALFWVEPEERGILPFDTFHISKSLKKTVRKTPYQVVADKNFSDIIAGCAESKKGRQETWINKEIRTLYKDLFDMGHCHAIEVYEKNKLIGGLYGVRLGSAFFGESMFSHKRDTSKIALVHLVARLIAGGFKLLDTQFTTTHLKTFGAIDVPRERYQLLLEDAIMKKANFKALPDHFSGEQAIKIIESFQNQ